MRALLASLCIALAGCATLPRAESVPNAAWVAFDRAGVRTAGASGWADRQAGRALTVADPVRIASVSKLVVALGVLRLVDEGRLDLDADVGPVLGWPLRNPAFPDRAVTLRHLLSHTSSLTDGVDYAVPLGTRLSHAVARQEAWDTEHPPGTFFRYSNLNFPAIASVMERATGERFDRLMARLVLRPLGLDACFNWTTCSDAAVARAVVLTGADGAAIRDHLAGVRPACPVLVTDGRACDLASYELGSNGALFSPQGGLRISARDLAVIGRMLLNQGEHDGRPFLSSRSLALMTGPVWRFDGRNGETESGFYCAYGLGVQLIPVRQAGCRDDLFGDGSARIGHAGEAYGVRSGLWVDPASGRGIAFFATGNGDAPPPGRSAFTAVEERLARRGH